MKRLPDVSLNRISTLRRQGMRVGSIAKTLSREGLPGHRTTVSKHVHASENGGTEMYYKYPSGIGRVRKLTDEHAQFIDEQMREDDEITARDLQTMLEERFGANAGLSTIKRRRREKGWVTSRPRYCQMVKNVNAEKRLAWCQQMVAQEETFDNVIFTDESIVSLESHTRLCFRKLGDPTYRPKLKPRPKHPVKVYVWAGISKRGPTKIVTFTGIMDSNFYIRQILHRTFRPWVKRTFPDGHRLLQDNDPKHTSHITQAYLRGSGLNWFSSPAESPDLNPIELLWHEMKDFLRKHVKPKNREQLVAGIERFWKTVDAAKCQRYIGHLRKVIPAVIAMEGRASGY